MSEASNTPGSKAIENYNKLQQSLTVFKKPTTLGVVKKKPKILTEEKYIEEMAKIIQRDFFPDLEKLKAQNDYLDAMEKKDFAEMEIIRAKYSCGRKPNRTQPANSPATFETPASNITLTPRHDPVLDTPRSTTSNTTTKSKVQSIAECHSLDSFLQNYTSEDNYSFQEIIETAEEKLRQKFTVLYNEEKLSAEKLARALTLPSIEEQFDVPDPMRKIETWTYTNKNSIMYTPDGVDFTKTEQVEAAKGRQILQHGATRFSVDPFNNQSDNNSVQLSRSQIKALSDKVGMDGNPLGNNSQPAPQIRGFDLLKTPSPRPGEAFSPLMTWGEIEGTPFRLDGSDTPIRAHSGPSFHINENSRRENIALALAEKVGEKMRAQKQRAKETARRNSESPFIRSNMERLASMSPAARRLATMKFGLRTPLLTPSPASSRTPLKSKRKTTPASISKTPSRPFITSTSNINESNLTDNLLNIPTTKRLKASDFF